jgi:hypothetical protein
MIVLLEVPLKTGPKKTQMDFFRQITKPFVHLLLLNDAVRIFFVKKEEDYFPSKATV